MLICIFICTLTYEFFHMAAVEVANDVCNKVPQVSVPGCRLIGPPCSSAVHTPPIYAYVQLESTSTSKSCISWVRPTSRVVETAVSINVVPSESSTTTTKCHCTWELTVGSMSKAGMLSLGVEHTLEANDLRATSVAWTDITPAAELYAEWLEHGDAPALQYYNINTIPSYDISQSVISSVSDNRSPSSLRSLLNGIPFVSGQTIAVNLLSATAPTYLRLYSANSRDTTQTNSVWKVTSDTAIHLLDETECAASTSLPVVDFDAWEAAAMERNPIYPSKIKQIINRIKTSHYSGGTKGVLICGDLGCGKSTVLRNVADACPSANVYVVKAHDVFKAAAGASERCIQRLAVHAIHKATPQRPSIILLDDVEALLPAKMDGLLQRRVARALYSLAEHAFSMRTSLWLLASASDKRNIQAAAIAENRFGELVQLEPLTATHRAALLHYQLRGLGAPAISDVIQKVAERAHGFSLADLAGCLRSAVQFGAQDAAIMAKIESAVRSSKPTLLRDAIGRAPSPNIEWEQLRSLTPAGPAAMDALMTAISHADAFRAAGISPPHGMLLYGPPGTGKSEMAHALTDYLHHCGHANALVVHGPDIISSLVGSSEATLSAIFARARELAPCILVFDQFEVLAPQRQFGTERASNNQSFDRLLSVLLTEMDGVGPTASHGGTAIDIFVLAITRDPESLDPAILRPGRLDVHIELGLPDAGVREQILEFFFRKSSIDEKAALPSSTEHAALWPDLRSKLVDSTVGWSPASLQSLWQGAALFAVRAQMAGRPGATIWADDINQAYAEIVRHEAAVS